VLDSPLEQLTWRAFRVPTDGPEADGTLSWNQTTVVVATVEAGGTTGVGWTYAPVACGALVGDALRPMVLGTDSMDVPGTHEAMIRQCRNFGRPGVVGCAISAVDVALWDLKARLLGLSLGALWGRCRTAVPIYGSGGFTSYDDETTIRQLKGWVDEQGIPRVKIKVGESWGSAERRDLDRAGLARRVVGPDAELYVDANGGYTRKQAVRVGRQLADHIGVGWLEEPVSSDDLVGLAHVRQQVSADVAAGEYGYSEPYFAAMIAAEAVDCLQLDVTRCGGYTSWLRAAALAWSAGLEVSGHCAPNLHAHVGTAVPNLRHVELFHDHERVDALLFAGTLDPSGGSMSPDPDAPGHGMELQDAAEEYRVA
jgi:L-alanine-DL-glutamate epimerase-like enolase superfamily enzyme